MPGTRLAAQTPEAPAETASPAPAEPKSGKASSILDLLPAEYIFLEDQAGHAVPVPRGATLEKWLEFLKQPLVKPGFVPPPSVAVVELSGTANDERAIVTAKFVIKHVAANDEFVPVALGLNEAVLRTDWTYDGPGEMSDKGFDRAQGYSWWLRGKGLHTLTLELSVPVRKQAAVRRLQLSLPDATRSKLALEVPFADLTAKSGGDAPTITRGERTSNMELLGLGNRLDLTWQPVVVEPSTTPLLEAETTILAYASREDLLLEAYQRLQVVQGTVSEVTVTLPSRAALVSVEGPDYRTHRLPADQPGRVVVQLTGPVSRQTQLNWTLRLPAAEQRKFVLDGFQVEAARKQSGQIGLIPLDDLRLSVSQTDHPQLLQINAAELRPLSAQVTRAYRFFSQPFRVALGMETVEPYFTAEPRLTLSAALNELTLEGSFALNVLRGKLRTAEIDWPNWKADGWILESIEPRGEVIEGVEAEAAEPPGRLRLKLVEEHVEQFVLRLKARRPIRAGEPVSVTLPQLTSPDSAPTRLQFVETDNVTGELTPIGETVVEIQAAAADEPAVERPAFVPRKARNYRVYSGEQVFTLRTARQERRVQAASLTTLELNGARLRCVQSLQFDVEHERLAQVRLSIPEGVRPASVRFQLDAERGLEPTWTTQDGQAVATLTLPEPRLGQFTLQAAWELPLTNRAVAGETAADVPVFSCPEFPIRPFGLQLSAEAEADLAVVDAAWKPRAEPGGAARWTAEGPVSLVRLQWEPGGGSVKPVLIRAAEIRAEWDRQGTAQCVANYRLSGVAAQLNLVLPADSTLMQVLWDGRPLAEPVEIISEGRPRHYALRVDAPGNGAAEHRLTVHYQLPSQQTFGLWNRWRLPAPQLPQGRWLAQGIWHVRFPGDQHLFTYPASVTPRFQWERRGLFFSRISPTAAESDGPGNSYGFGQFGELQEFQCATMSGPMILLIGASVSLLAGFLVINFARLRHIMTLWAAVFAIALTGLWFRPQLEVLL